MDKSITKLKMSEVCYLMFILYWVIIRILQFNFSDTVLVLGLLAVIVLALFGFINKTYTVRELIISITVLALGGILLFTANIEGFLVTGISIVALKNIDIKKMCWYVLIIGVILFFSIVFLSLVGVIDSTILTTNRTSGEVVMEVTKNSLGFARPNGTYRSFFVLFTLYYYVRYECLNVIDYITTVVLAYYIYIKTECRTGFVCILFFCVLVMLMKYTKCFEWKFISKLLPWCPIIFAIFSFLSAKYYTNSSVAMNMLNNIFSNRLLFGQIYMQKHPIKLFGQEIVDVATGQYLQLDNGYLQMILGYGLVASLLFIVLTFFIIKKLVRHGYNIELIIVLSFALYGIMESILLDSSINFSLLFYSCFIYKNSIYNYSYKEKDCVKSLQEGGW